MSQAVKITAATHERLEAFLAVVGRTQRGAVVRRALVRYLEWVGTLTAAELVAEGKEIRRATAARVYFE